MKEFNFINFLNNEDKSDLTEINLKSLFPSEISDEINSLNIIPVIMDDDIQLLIPFNIVSD